MDGLIAQIERYCFKHAYAKMTTATMDRILSVMRQKKRKSTGNVFTFIVNEILWDQIQAILAAYLMSWKTVGTFMFSQKNGEDVKVGNDGYTAYSYAGNTIQFVVDKSLSLEYDDRGLTNQALSTVMC